MQILNFRLNRLRSALHICSNAMRRMFVIPYDDTSTDGKIFFDQINDIAVNRKNMFRSCIWAGEVTDCEQFKYVMTEKGPCFSFNVLNSNRIYTNM